MAAATSALLPMALLAAAALALGTTAAMTKEAVESAKRRTAVVSRRARPATSLTSVMITAVASVTCALYAATMAAP